MFSIHRRAPIKEPGSDLAAAFRLSAVLLVCCLMTACEPVGSIHPLYTEEVAVAEPRLIGTWDAFDGGRLFATVTIEQGLERVYRGIIRGAENDQAPRFTVVLVRLSETLYADASFEPWKAGNGEESDPPPPHSFYRVRVGEHTLEIVPLQAFLLQRLLDERRVDIAHERKNQGIVVAAPTAELQSLLTLHGTELVRKADRLVLYRRETDGRMVKLKEELAGNSSDPESYRVLGELHLGRGRYEDARAAFQQALRLNPKSTVYLDELGDALVAQAVTMMPEQFTERSRAFIPGLE